MGTKRAIKVTVGGAVSTLVLVVLFLTPVLPIALGSASNANLGLAGLLAFVFWPSGVLIARLAIRERELPVIVGGPRFIRPGKPGPRHLTVEADSSLLINVRYDINLILL